MPAIAKEKKKDWSSQHLFLVTSLFWFTQYAFASYLNPELERMGASATLMGLCGTVYGLSQLLARVPFGFFSTAMGQNKPFVVAGCVLAFVACLGMYVFYSPLGFLVFRAVAGMASGAWVCFTVLYGSYFPKGDAPRNISLLDMGGQLGKLVCYLLVLNVVAAFSCRAALVVGLLSGALTLLLSISIKETRLQKQKLRWADLKRVAGNRHLLVCSLLASFAQFIQCGTYLSFTQNLATRLRADNTQLTILNIALLLPTVLWNLFANKVMIKKIGAQKTVVFGFACGALYCLLVPFVQSITALYLCQILGAANTSVALAVLLGQSMRDIAPRHRSMAMSLFQVLFSVGMTLGPLFMGVLVDMSSLNTAFLVMAGVGLLAVVLTVVLYEEKQNVKQIKGVNV